MSIEISTSTAGRAFTPATGTVQLRRSSSEAAQPAQKSDSVNVSREALLLQEAKRTAQAAPDVRTEKVAALRDQVQNGTYTINSTLIASRILSEEPGLFV